MFIGVIARPIDKFQFDSKIFLRPISRSKVVKKKSKHQRFVPDRNLNKLVKSRDWRNHADPNCTVGELLDSISNFYEIDDETHCCLALIYNTFSSARAKVGKIILDYSCEEKFVLDRHIFIESKSRNGQTANLHQKITINDYKLKVNHYKGDIYQ